jgi:hypothetical protein
MERFSSGDRYNHDEDENRNSRKNRPLRNITSIYGKSTDQPTSSVQGHDNYGEKLAESLWNWLWSGQSDAPGHGSHEHEDGYIDHNQERIYDTHHQDRTDHDIPSSSSVEQEREMAKELFGWAKTFRERFNIRKDRVEDWVQAGIEQQLGIELKDFRKSYRQLRKLIEDSSPESYEELAVANAKFKHIREILKWGIPVAGIPDYICGRKVTNVDGKGYNCLIRALLKGAHPKWEDKLIEAGVEDMRYLLEENNLVKEGAMLDLGSEEGTLLINSVKKANWIEPDREVLVYQYREGKIQCFSITDGTSDKPPYAILREHDGEHFRAIEVPE